MLHRIRSTIFDILFPPICICCATYMHDATEPLCAKCYAMIEKNTALSCPICSRRLANNKRACRHGKRDLVRFPYILGAPAHYGDPVIKRSIHACKYEGMHSVSATLARLLTEYGKGLEPQPHIFNTRPIVVPIPLHHKKDRKRGFNQSALIARSFADQMNFSYDEPLIKVINNDAQAQTKTHQERFARIQNGFAIPNPAHVRNKNIILIDDVSTSGATLSEAARTLKAAGARHILALVIAKA